MNPLVSIIIPNYNSEPFLEACLESAINQTYSNIEIIIVDDGSQDKSLEIIRKYKKKELKVFPHTRNRLPKGAPTCRNIGISKAKGDYIMFLDADDIIKENKIESQIGLLNGSTNNIALCNCYLFRNSDLTNLEKLYIKDSSFTAPAMDWIVELLISGKFVTSHSWLVPKRIIEKTGFWNETLIKNQDGEYFIRIINNTEKIKFAADTDVYYRKGVPSSITASNTKEKAESVLRSFYTYVDIFEERTPIKYEKALSKLFYGFYYYYYPEYWNLLKEAKYRGQKYSKTPPKPFGSVKVMAWSKYIGWKRAKELEHMAKVLKIKFNNLKKHLRYEE